MVNKEGKFAYNATGYTALCQYFDSRIPAHRPDKCRGTFKGTWGEGMFASLFTKLSVATIGRSDNIDDCLLSSLGWEDDSLTISFSTTKSDQAGVRTSEKKRIYANPYKPDVCIVLSLAVYIWTHRRTSKEQCTYLFQGENQHKRYYETLMDALENIPEGVDMGCDREDIGTHSNRKFAESSSASHIDGPTGVQVSLRAGQSIGRTHGRYMFPEEDGDALCGRCLALLNMDASQFDVLPIHFGLATLAYLHT